MGQCEKIFYPFFNQNTLYKTLIHLSYVQYEYCRLLAFHNRLGVLAAGNILFLHFNIIAIGFMKLPHTSKFFLPDSSFESVGGYPFLRSMSACLSNR